MEVGGIHKVRPASWRLISLTQTCVSKPYHGESAIPGVHRASTMARSYGAASADRDDGPGEGDNAPLLGTGVPKVVEADQEDGHATVVSCVGNLANTIIGSGMLTFPLVSHFHRAIVHMLNDFLARSWPQEESFPVRSLASPPDVSLHLASGC